MNINNYFKQSRYLKNIARIVLLLTATNMLCACSGGGKLFKHKQIGGKELVLPENKVVPLSTTATAKKDNSLALLSSNNYLLKPDASVEVTISEHGYTRFSLEDERISDVFVYPQEALQVRIHDVGYLVVVPDQRLEGEDNSQREKIYITITGEQGTTQDMLLRFTGKNPEPVKFMKFGNNN